MRPSAEVLVALVLQLILTALVEFNEHMSYILWHTAVLHIIVHGFMDLVGQDSEWFWLWRGRNLLDKVVPEGVLLPRIFQENGLRSDVEHSIVSLDYSIEK